MESYRIMAFNSGGSTIFVYLVILLNMSILLLFFLAGQDIFLQMTSSSGVNVPPQKRMIIPEGPSRPKDIKNLPHFPPGVVRGMGQRKIADRNGQTYFSNPNRVKDKDFYNIGQKAPSPRTNLCGGKEFCENPEVYPTLLVNKLIKRIMVREGGSHSLIALLDEDRDNLKHTDLKTEGRSASSLSSPLSARDGLDDKETPVCVSTQEYIIPRRAITKDNNYRFIINHRSKQGNSSLIQKVLIGKCFNPGSECTLGSDIKPSVYGLKTVCRQKYTYKRLLAVSDSGEEIVDSFKFPSCCVCHYMEGNRDLNH